MGERYRRGLACCLLIHVFKILEMCTSGMGVEPVPARCVCDHRHGEDKGGPGCVQPGAAPFPCAPCQPSHAPAVASTDKQGSLYIKRSFSCFIFDVGRAVGSGCQ